MLKSSNQKGFTMIELIVVLVIVAVFCAILAPALLSYTEESRVQKDESAMDEVVNSVNLAMADSETFDEVFGYSIPNNYITYTDSSGLYGQKFADEEFWAPDGSGHAVTITFNPDENGNYDIAQGVVNNMTNGNGSVADPRTADGLKTCTFEEMGNQKLYAAVKQAIGNELSEKSATYKNSSYTLFIKFDFIDGAYQPSVYGQFNGTNLSPDCHAAIGSGTSEYTPEGEAIITKPTGGTQAPVYSNSDLQGGGTIIVPPAGDATPPVEEPEEEELPATSPILEENDWETIQKVVQAGKAAEAGWKVGDTKVITSNGAEFNVAIIGINHDGDNTVTFMVMDVYASRAMNSTATNDGGWETSEMRAWLNGEVYNSLDIKGYIKEVSKMSNNVGYGGTEATETKDKLFLVALAEVGKPDSIQCVEGEGTTYEWFTNNSIDGNYAFRTASKKTTGFLRHRSNNKFQHAAGNKESTVQFAFVIG